MLTDKSVVNSKSKPAKPIVHAASIVALEKGGATTPQAIYASDPLRGESSLFSLLFSKKDSSNDMELVNLVQNRLPLSVIDRLLAVGVSKQEIDLVAPPRTLAHRRANAQRLTVDESDRAVRLARVVAQTESVFCNQDKAMAWLRKPMKRFEGHTPIEMLVTDVGSRLVEEALVQIDEGFFA